MSKFKTVCGVIAFVLFFLMLGAVGAIEQDIVPLFPGMVRVFALMALWVLFCNLGIIESGQEAHLDRRRKRSIQIEVLYFLKSKENMEFNAWAEEMYDQFETLTVKETTEPDFPKGFWTPRRTGCIYDPLRL